VIECELKVKKRCTESMWDSINEEFAIDPSIVHSYTVVR